MEYSQWKIRGGKMKKYIIWFYNFFFYNKIKIFGMTIGIALTIAFLSAIGIIIDNNNSLMTKRTIESLPVDWQLQISHNENIQDIKNIVNQAVQVNKMQVVNYAEVNGFFSQTNNTTQTTGPGIAVGISNNYFKLFPSEFRKIKGNDYGVLLTQQAASNLHADIGSKIVIFRKGLKPTSLIVQGIIDMPYADSFFQKIGVPSNLAPQAPPDNVIILPDEQWHNLFDKQSKTYPDSTKTEMHISLNHNIFSSDPNIAFTQATHIANNIEAKLSGKGIIGNNLAACLNSIRSDAIFAKILFLFLGLPGVIVAIILALNIINSRNQSRNSELALLQIRGASFKQAIILQFGEAFTISIIAIIFSLILLFILDLYFNFNLHKTSSISWITITSAMGFLLITATIISHSLKKIRSNKVISSEKTITNKKSFMWWESFYLDFIFLAIGALEFIHISSIGYKIVVVPEGLPVISVNYESFIAPICIWIGGILLLTRIVNLLFIKNKKILTKLFKPLSGNLSETIISGLSRQHSTITNGIIIVSLAVSFAISTSVFNSTYNSQQQVDALLSNGADIRVEGTTYDNVAKYIKQISTISGVKKIEPMMHKLAYVGNDLQDIYGINPESLMNVTKISNAYFANHNAKNTMDLLNKNYNGILVSEETAQNYQLKLGDMLNIRLQNAKTGHYEIVPFKFLGIVREFPTAPKDSFLVANASYIAEKTGYTNPEVLLIKANNPALVSKKIENILSSLPQIKVSNIDKVNQSIKSQLTSINLHALTKLELIFAIILVASATGLLFGLELSQKKQSFAVIRSLGASDKQLNAFILTQSIVIVFGGCVTGIILGFIIVQVLVKVLTGVFDPPPDFLTIPFGYIVLTLVVILLSTTITLKILTFFTKYNILKELKK